MITVYEYAFVTVAVSSSDIEPDRKIRMNTNGLLVHNGQSKPELASRLELSKRTLQRSKIRPF